jgi:hypothetical protein
MAASSGIFIYTTGFAVQEMKYSGLWNCMKRLLEPEPAMKKQWYFY